MFQQLTLGTYQVPNSDSNSISSRAYKVSTVLLPIRLQSHPSPTPDILSRTPEDIEKDRLVDIIDRIATIKLELVEKDSKLIAKDRKIVALEAQIYTQSATRNRKIAALRARMQALLTAKDRKLTVKVRRVVALERRVRVLEARESRSIAGSSANYKRQLQAQNYTGVQVRVSIATCLIVYSTKCLKCIKQSASLKFLLIYTFRQLNNNSIRLQFSKYRSSFTSLILAVQYISQSRSFRYIGTLSITRNMPLSSCRRTIYLIQSLNYIVVIDPQ